jgi:ABC-type sugar transport system ATPase subunit
MRAEIKRLQRDIGATMVYVTHDQEEALTLAESLVVLRAGKVEQVGDPQAVYDRPQTAFVAGFLGNPPVNLVAGRYDESTRHVSGRDFQCRLPAGYTVRPGADDVWLGVRPEDIRVVDRAAQGAFSARGKVDLIEPLGRQVLVTVLVGEQRVKAFTPLGDALELGQDVWLGLGARGLDPRHPDVPGHPDSAGHSDERILLFDRRTGHVL